MDDYEADILIWSERQAALLRRVGAGEQVNALVDWDNVAEEVESVGRSQLVAKKSLLIQGLAHKIKAEVTRRAALASRSAWVLDRRR